MINLEFYRDEIIEKNKSIDAGRYFECVLCKVRNKIYDCRKPCHQCLEESVDWLLEEYKEPIKLKQWEYDMIESNNMSHANVFDAFYTYRAMKGRGYFKGIKDTSMTLEDILDNCEVVE